MSEETTEAAQGTETAGAMETSETLTPESESPSTQTTSVETASTNWKTSLPEEIREHAALAKYDGESVESLAKGYIHASSMIGQEKLVKPSNDEEWSNFYNEMGRPAEATGDKGYKFKTYEVPEPQQEYVTGRVESFKDMSHKLGLSADQAAGLHDWYMDGNVENMQQANESIAESERVASETLKKDWGQSYDAKLGIAQSALKEYADETFIEFLEGSNLGNHPSMLRIFNQIGEAMMEDSQLEGAGVNKTPLRIQESINTIMAKPAYWDADSPERVGLVREVTDLMKQLHPEK